MGRKLAKMALTSDIEPDFSMENYTSKLPPHALMWLDKYGVTEQERIVNRIVYDLEKDLLVLPIYDGDRLVVTNCRYFGDNPDYPKYITKGWKSGHFKLFPKKDSNVFVLTEDYLSALKVGRVSNAIPLLGTHIPNTLILSLVSKRPTLCIWLDRDKAIDSIRLAGRARQFIPKCVSIVTERDPKDYTTEEINEFVLQHTQKFSSS
jgi:DNA primase